MKSNRNILHYSCYLGQVFCFQIQLSNPFENVNCYFFRDTRKWVFRITLSHSVPLPFPLYFFLFFCDPLSHPPCPPPSYELKNWTTPQCHSLRCNDDTGSKRFSNLIFKVTPVLAPPIWNQYSSIPVGGHKLKFPKLNPAFLWGTLELQK